jgi:hypothetical protein
MAFFFYIASVFIRSGAAVFLLIWCKGCLGAAEKRKAPVKTRAFLLSTASA